jgi:iron complex transport system ATP-binding protein
MELTIQQLAICLDDATIVDDISLHVGKGEFVGIIGPNGSGKSTLLRAVYRMVSPLRGSILLDGRALDSFTPPEAARNLGVVGQFNNVPFDFSVLQMVLMGRAPHKRWYQSDTRKDYQIASAALEKVGLAQHADKSYAALSGGEKQRVILARALAQEPKLLILDEPTNHLDIKYQLQILSIVKQLGIGVLSVLHDLNLAAMHCARLYVLKEGKLMASGTPQEVLTPALLREVYEVSCTVRENKQTGSLDISYYPADLPC